MILTIDVKEDHISQGEPGSPHRCPVALALREQGFADITVDSYIRFTGLDGQHYFGCTPETVKHFILGFDFYWKVPPKPFSFCIQVEPEK